MTPLQLMKNEPFFFQNVFLQRVVYYAGKSIEMPFILLLILYKFVKMLPQDQMLLA